MVPKSTKTPGQEGKERVHSGRGNQPNANCITSYWYEGPYSHPKTPQVSVEALDKAALNYFQKTGPIPDTEFLESGFIEYFKTAVYEFINQDYNWYDIKWKYGEFYYLGIGFKLDKPNNRELYDLYGNKCLNHILEDIQSIVFILYRIHLKRYKAFRAEKYRPFSVFIRYNILMYIGSHLRKLYKDSLAVYQQELPEIIQEEEVEDIKTLPEASGWPLGLTQVGKIANISRNRMWHYLQSSNRFRLLVIKGFLKEVNNGNNFERQTKLVQNRE